MFFNKPASLSPSQDRSRSCTDRIEGGRSRNASGRRLFSNLTRSRPASPERLVPAREIERSQSQLNMSTFASLEQVASSQSDALSRPASRNSRYLAGEGRSARQPTLARSLFHKSSRLLQKRKSVANLHSAVGVSVWEDDDPVQRFTPEMPHRYLTKQTRHPHDRDSVLKHAISEPFNFQHLTHTSPNHARALANANESNLVTEFCAMRAAQKPRTELKGIKATDLPSGQNSEAVSLAATSAYHTPATSRPTTPGLQRVTLQPSKSADNFTLLANWTFNAPCTPLMPPPRRSSRKPVPLANVFIGDSEGRAQDSPTLPGFSKAPSALIMPAASEYSTPALFSPSPAFSYFESPVEIAQAVTTPDDTAYEIVPRLPPPPPIPSEETAVDVEQPDTPKQASTVGSRTKSLRHTRSFPSVKHFSRTFLTCPIIKKGESGSSDPTLPVPGSEKEDIPSRMSGRVSTAPKSIHESWEDSVDYCYDFAMEDELVEDHPMPGSFQTVHNQKSMNSMSQPDLSDSATSSAVSVPGIITPSDALPYSAGPLATPRDFDGSTMFPLSPSLLVPKEYSSRITHEESYQNKLSDAEPKNRFNFYDDSIDSDVRQNWSPRSSAGSRPLGLTASTSADSLNFGFAGQMASNRHSTSVGSMPDLVRSQPSRDHLAVANGLAAFKTGVSDLPSTIDCLRGDLIRAADDLPEHHFAVISPTLTPPPTTLTLRSRSSSESAENALSIPPTPISAHHPLAQREGRNRSNSAAHSQAPRQRGHRTSYSLFPGPSMTRV